MSADNGLLVKKNRGVWEIYEYDASTGSKRPLIAKDMLESAVRWAEEYQRHNLVEYGISFDFGKDLSATGRAESSS